MDITYDDENRRRRLLVILLALLICVSSATALGFAQVIVSKATNTENVISGEGLETRLLDLEGESLPGGGFATDNKCWHVRSDWVNGIFSFEVVPLDDVLIGHANLEIKTDHSNIPAVKIWYTIKWDHGEGETLLNIGEETPIEAEEENAVTVSLTEDITVIEVKLYGKVTPEKVDDKYTAKYTIVFHVSPVQPDDTETET